MAQSRVAIQQRVNVGISHPFHAADHSSAKLLPDDVATMIDLEQHRKHQPVDSGFQGTDLSGKLERKHRHRAIRKIHAGAAQESLVIDRCAGRHVMADVGDVDMKRIVAAGDAIPPYGIVEIASRFPIDGNDVHVAKILTACKLVEPDDVRITLRLLQNFRRKMMRDMMLADDDLDVHAEIVRMSQDFDHPPHSMLAIFRKLKNLDADDHSVEVLRTLDFHWFNANAIFRCRGRRQFAAFRNLDPLMDTLIVRNYVAFSRANSKLTHHGLVRTPQNPDNLAVCAAIALDTGDADHYAIAVHGSLRGIARDVDVAANALQRSFRNQKAVTVAVHIKPAHGVFTAETRSGEVTGTHLHQLALVRQPVERGFHFLPRSAV